MKEKSITVSSAELKKQGTTNGKNWSIYQVVDQDGVKFSTFEKQLAQLGIPAHVWYDEEERSFVDKKGKTVNYKQRTIRKFEVGAEFNKTVNIETGEQSGTQGQVEPKDASIAQLEARVAVLEGIVLKKEMEEDETSEQNPGLTIDDLPF